MQGKSTSEEIVRSESIRGWPVAVGQRSFVLSRWVSFVLILADVFVLSLAIGLGLGLRLWLAPLFPNTIGPDQYQQLFYGVFVLPLGYALAGLYPGYGVSPVERLRRRILTTLLTFTLLISWEFLVVREGWSRGVLLFSFGLSLVFIPLTDALVRGLLGRMGIWGTPSIVLGAGRTSAVVVRQLLKVKGLGLIPVAILDDDPEKWGSEIEGIPVTGGIDAADRYVREGVSTAIVAMPGLSGEKLVRLADSLAFPKVLVIPDLLGMESLWVSARDLGGILGLEIQKSLLHKKNWLLKRFMDYFFGVPLFLLSVPVVAFLALWVFIVSPGSPFYGQEREGYKGRVIRVWKLRTMYPDAEDRLKRHLQADPQAREEWERYYKLKNDPRVLPGVGHFLRKTSLDELPQLWNVIKGEMSLVGPRPFPFYHLEAFSQEFREMRRRVMPGITGYWQVSARSEGDLEQQEALDSYYIRNWSIWFDVYILARTVGVVLLRKGAY